MEDVDISDLMGKGLVMAVCMGDKKQAYKIIHKVARRNSEEVLLGVCNGLHDLLSDLDKIDPEFRIEFTWCTPESISHRPGPLRIHKSDTTSITTTPTRPAQRFRDLVLQNLFSNDF